MTGYGLLKIFAVIIRMLPHIAVATRVLKFIVTLKWHICICPWQSSASLAINTLVTVLSTEAVKSQKMNCCSVRVIFEYSCPGNPILLSIST